MNISKIAKIFRWIDFNDERADFYGEDSPEELMVEWGLTKEEADVLYGFIQEPEVENEDVLPPEV